LLTGVGTPEEYGAHSIRFSRGRTFIVQRISLTSDKASRHDCKRELFKKNSHNIKRLMFYAEYVLRLEFKLYADFDVEGKYVKNVGLLIT
jgi:hypothetical protein